MDSERNLIVDRTNITLNMFETSEDQDAFEYAYNHQDGENSWLNLNENGFDLELALEAKKNKHLILKIYLLASDS